MTLTDVGAHPRVLILRLFTLRGVVCQISNTEQVRILTNRLRSYCFQLRKDWNVMPRQGIFLICLSALTPSNALVGRRLSTIAPINTSVLVPSLFLCTVRKAILPALLACTLAGCVTPDQERANAAQQHIEMERYFQKLCSDRGLKKGTQVFSSCVSDQHNIAAQERMAARAQANALLMPYMRPYQSQKPLNCSHVGNNTTCY